MSFLRDLTSRAGKNLITGPHKLVPEKTAHHLGMRFGLILLTK